MNPFIAKDDGKYVLFSITFAVVPYVGTWIEISCCRVAICHIIVVPYVGTWIEILPWLPPAKWTRCRSLRGNVDRNRDVKFLEDSEGCRSLRGNVDRNIATSAQVLRLSNRRSLRGNVDRNLDSLSALDSDVVVPYVGTWIEIEMMIYTLTSCFVVPYVGTWIEMGRLRPTSATTLRSFPTWERG